MVLTGIGFDFTMNRMGSIDILVDSADKLRDCAQDLAGCERIGFDTEFVGEATYTPDLCLVQLATPERLYVIDPLAIPSLDDVWEILTDPARTVIVHAGREEIRMCHRFAGRPPAGLFDVQIAAGLLGLGYPLGHGPLLQQTLGVRLMKGETLTDWRRRPLTGQQIAYAFDDVRYLLRLHERLGGRLDQLDRLGWADEEFAALIRQALMPAPQAERWRKLRGIGNLDRRKLAVVKELFEWRDAEAERLNRPPRTLLRDDLLVEVARRDPRRPGDLKALRGLGDADPAPLLERIKAARDLPADALPEAFERENDPPQVGLVAALLQAVLNDWCGRNQLTPGLVAGAQDLRGLVRARAAGRGEPADSPLARGWRGEQVLPFLSAVLDGRRLIRVGDLGRECPLELTDAV